MFNNQMLKRLIPFVILILTSCTRSGVLEDPKGKLTEYISTSFSIREVEDKAKLMTFLTGDVKARLKSWSDDQFQEAFIEGKRQFVKLTFRELKKISQNEVTLTYELIYIDPGKDPQGRSHEAKITNKKLCQMIFEGGKWLIADVRNIKELIEYKNELTLP